MQILAGVGAPLIGDFESIATTTVGAGGQATISFTSIPNTYKHLQLRAIVRDASAVNDFSATKMVINSDTSTAYTRHILYGDYAGNYASGYNGTTGYCLSVVANQGSTTANTFCTNVIDFIDYQNTNKYKTIRTIYGTATNAISQEGIFSNLWQSTSAISSLSFTFASAANFAQYTHFALYGIKG